MGITENRAARSFWFCSFFFLVIDALASDQPKNGTFVGTHPDLLESFTYSNSIHEFSNGKLYYRTLYLDDKEDRLYVGAMDNIFMLNSTKISETSQKKNKLDLTPKNIAKCLSQIGIEDLLCHNHIKIIQPLKDDDALYICGTNAFLPSNWVIYRNLTQLPSSKSLLRHRTLSKCSPLLDNSATTVWVGRNDDGYPTGIYTARNVGNSACIFRTHFDNLTAEGEGFDEVQTPEYDATWLDQPNFVGSFDVGQYVFFFFSEYTEEDENQEEIITFEEPLLEASGDEKKIEYKRVIYSRVARVNKKDVGLGLSNYWSEYSRARLNCSIPSGETFFYFNKIQSIYKMPNDDTRFYGIFIATMNNSDASAICSFHIDAIQEVFRGGPKSPVVIGDEGPPKRRMVINKPSEKVSDMFPTLRGQVYKFDLVSKMVVPPENGFPVFHQYDGGTLTKLIVVKMRVDFLEPNLKFLDFTVYYAGSDNGTVHKIVQWIDDKNQSQSNVFDKLVVSPKEPIRAMEISMKHQSLYIATDNRIVQTPLAMCSSRYNNCQRCVRDPHCGWDKNTKTCQLYQTELLQDASNAIAEVCDIIIGKQNLTVPINGNLYIKCFVGKPKGIKYEKFRWYQYNGNNEKIQMTNKNYSDELNFLMNWTDGIFIEKIREEDAGEYECWFGSILMASYKITIGVDLTLNSEALHDSYEIELPKIISKPVDENNCTGLCPLFSWLGDMSFVS